MLKRPLPLYEEILLLALISEEEKTRSAAQWVSKFSGTKARKKSCANG